MAKIDTTGLTPLQCARVNAELEKRVRIAGDVMTWREYVTASKGERRVWDGSADYNRRRFNSMTGAEQRAYEARLAARRYYTVDGVVVPKCIHDAVTPDDDAQELQAFLTWTDADSVALFGKL
jgi:hypothetical protein